MTKREIISRIINLVENETGEMGVCESDIISLMTINEYDNSNNLLSSLGIVSILVSLEREFNIEIEDEEILQFNTIIELADLVYKKLKME